MFPRLNRYDCVMFPTLFTQALNRTFSKVNKSLQFRAYCKGVSRYIYIISLREATEYLTFYRLQDI